MSKWLKLIACILICQSAGILGSIFTAPSIAVWYVGLAKPWFTPPNWLFGPVWIILYMLMGISLYLIISNGLKKKETRQSLAIFGVQLALNTLWSIVFFGLKSKFYGFVNILALWASILFMILSFYRISKKAALLLVPYIVWVTIATLLNYYVWILNP